ncbi:MAG: GNAT family N-acetyltransferase [Chloroflexi bacterium]|nr:GNAT family N-acetyltransferase [Chloroflexota bacterium]
MKGLLPLHNPRPAGTRLGEEISETASIVRANVRRASLSHSSEPYGSHLIQPADIRNFTWDDFNAVFDARAAVTGIPASDADEARSHFRARLELPGADPTDNVFIAVRSGGVVGCAIVAVETAIDRAVGEFGVTESARGRGVGRSLLERLEQRSTEAGVAVHQVNVHHSDTRLRSIMEAAGYSRIRTFNELKYRPAPAYLEADYRPLPAGVTLRPFRTGHDERALADVQNIAFEGSFGFAPNTPEQIAGYVATRGAPGDILIAEDDASGEVIGYVWTSVSTGSAESPESTGMIEMTGVRPDQRGRGVGSAVIAAGLRHLRERGVGVVDLEVDDENVSARRIYRDLGFKKVGEQFWFEKRLAG